jgi:hypothetical protein
LFILFKECSGQICGSSDLSSGLQGVTVFNNSFFLSIGSSCEDAFMLTGYPPDVESNIDLVLPGFSSSEAIQVYSVLFYRSTFKSLTHLTDDGNI